VKGKQMSRITDKDLYNLVNAINERMRERGEPQSYQLGYAYGGVKLVNMGNGCRDVSHDGFGTKRELYTYMTGFLDGLNT
jgi:hypothetical protein